MEEELDLWEYLRSILRRWPIIVAGLVLTLAAMVAFWFLQPVRYEATATLLATLPQYDWRFDTGILNVVDQRKDWKSELMALAKSHNVVEAALTQAKVPGTEKLKPSALSGLIEAKAGPEGLFYLSVTWDTPEGATALANTLANQVIEQARALYGGGEDLSRFEASLQEASARLIEAEAALQAFKSEAGLDILPKGHEGLVGYSANERELDLRAGELAEHRAALANLALMVEESRRILAKGGDPAAFPWQLAASPVIAARGRLTTTLALQPGADPQAILELMEEEKQAIETITAQLEKQVSDLQARLAEQSAALGRLTLERNLARDAYSTLVRKVEELQARQIADAGNVRVVQPAVRAQAIRLRLSLAVMLGAFLGLLVGVVGALVADRLASPPKRVGGDGD